MLTIIATGIAMAGPPPTNGLEQETEHRSTVVAAQTQEDEGEEEGDESEVGPLGEVHETTANLLYLLILLHIAGVIFETWRSGRQVLVAMAPLGR